MNGTAANPYANDLSILNIDVFGDGSGWLFAERKIQAVRWMTTYEITVESDCPKSVVTINLAAS